MSAQPSSTDPTPTDDSATDLQSLQYDSLCTPPVMVDPAIWDASSAESMSVVLPAGYDESDGQSHGDDSSPLPSGTVAEQLLQPPHIIAADTVAEPTLEPTTELTEPVPTAEAAVEPPPKKKKKKAKAAADAPDAPAADPEGFADMPLTAAVQKAITASGYDIPTDVQTRIIPLILDGRDVLAQSQTGTGKTAAFALPILSRLSTKPGPPQVLVLAPTRELAMQVSESFSTYGNHMKGLKIATLYGGQDYEVQFRSLDRGAQIIVGTPGRTIDHIKRGSLDIGELKTLVLDEADEMLNMGFLEDVEFVLEQTPPGRQIALFSATLPGPIRQIADRFMTDAATVTIERQTMTASGIMQRALFVPPKDKIEVLRRLLEVEETDGVIVFTKTKDATIGVAEDLNRAGVSAVALNGDMPQRTRERTIDAFKSGRVDILVATDVAARGLDVPRISHVINFDMPHDTESYIHRIGRTGRAGREGVAIIFCTHAQRGKLRNIERVTKQPIEIIDAPGAENVNESRAARLKQAITDVTANEDLTTFKEVITRYAEESGKPLELIAAALAFQAHGGRQFFVRELPQQARGGFDRADRHGRDEHFGGDREDRGPRRQIGAPRPGMVRYQVAVGFRDGMRPGNLVGAIANEAGLDGSQIGPIDIKGSYATVDLPDGMPAPVFDTLQQTRVAGKPLRLRPFDPGKAPRHEGGGFHGGGGHGGGGGGGFRGKPKKFGGKKKFRKA